jgi:SRSO17 transposase
MDLRAAHDSESRFAAYVEGLASAIGRAGRAKPLRDYCVGLLMPCERKSVEPIAAMTAPARVSAQHQSLLHFVGEGGWSDQKVLAKVRELVLPEMERHGPIEAWIIDDTGFPKKGRHSVGVARQYCGQLGKQDNCQVAVTLSLANHHASLPVAYRLYLPKEWVTDRTRRRKAGVPKEITFKTKPAIAVDHLRWACAAGLPRGVVLMDAGYGTDTALRGSVTALGLSYVAGNQPQTSVWAPETGPRPPKKWSGNGRPPKLLRRDSKHRPISAKKLAIGLPSHAWHKITWREGTAERLSSRFARVRVRPAHRDYWLAESRPEEWLLIEWPAGEEAPTKYWLLGFRRTLASVSSSISSSCAGALSATTTNSNRKLALATSRGEAGVASTITQHCALPPTDFWSPSEKRFPPQKQPPPSCSRKLQFPKLIDRGDPPLRPERHVPNSIATVRRRLNAALVSTLSRCPCCIRPISRRSQ